MQITSKVQVDIVRRMQRRLATTSAAAFHTKHRAQRRLTQRQQRFFAQPPQAHRQPNRGGGLALARRRRIDRRHQDQPPRPALGTVQRSQLDLGFVAAVGNQQLVGKTRLASDLAQRLDRKWQRVHGECPVLFF